METKMFSSAKHLGKKFMQKNM